MWQPKLKTLVGEKARLEQRHIKQIDIAEATGLRAPTISLWMQPTTLFRRIDSDVAGRLAAFLDCEPHDLFEYVDVAEPADAK